MKTVFALVCFLLFFSTIGQAAVVHDCDFEKGAASQASPFSYASNAGTTACTPAATSSRVLICSAKTYGITASAQTMTWNSVSMTQIGTTVTVGNMGNSLWGLINPASGSQTLAYTWTGGTTDISLGCGMFSSADQSTGWQNYITANAVSTAATITVTTTSGNAVYVGHGNDNATSTNISSGTSSWNDQAFNGNAAAGYVLSSGASATVAWNPLGSSVQWVQQGVDIIAASAGGSFKPYSLPITGVGQ